MVLMYLCLHSIGYELERSDSAESNRLRSDLTRILSAL